MEGGSDPRQGSSRSRIELIERLRAATDSILLAAMADTGQTRELLVPDLEHIFELLELPSDRATELARFRTVGEQAAELGEVGAAVVDRYTTLAWVAWETARSLPDVSEAAVLDLADTMVRGMDVAIAAMARGYREVELRLTIASTERRRAVLDEIVSAPRPTPEDRARVARRAQRHGLDPDGTYRAVVIAVPGGDDEVLEDAVSRLELAASSSARGAHGVGIRLPQVLHWRGYVLVLAHDGWTGAARLPDALTHILADDWVAIDTGGVEGIEALPIAITQAVYALRVAGRLGKRGWIGDQAALALETTFLLDERQAWAAVNAELGPLLADERMGSELLETLRVWFESGQNLREVGRRMHLAPRTIAYRMERIERLLGHPSAGQAGMRVAAALLALDVLQGGERT